MNTTLETMAKIDSPGRGSEPPEPRESRLAAGWTVEGQTSVEPSRTAVGDAEEAAVASSDSAVPRPKLSNAAVVLLGAFGGLYLLYTWGWFAVVKAYADLNLITAAGSGIIGGVMQNILFWTIPAAPVLWFAVALVIGLKRQTAVLAVALVLGALVLVPLPALIGGAA